MTYELLDSGHQLKLERFGDYVLSRPCAQALWAPQQKRELWARADAHFSREEGKGWSFKKKLPDDWICAIEGVHFKIALTDFGHLGVFPEHSLLWKELRTKRPLNLLNLFAYSGGATLAAAQAGARVCHLDASKAMVAWAKENAALNQLTQAPIRWIVDDVFKFLKREVKRGVRYDGIILDPPSFGRGSKGEVFKIESDLHELLRLCVALLAERPVLLLFTTHTPGITPLVMEHLLKQYMGARLGTIDSGEMSLPSSNHFALPCGSFARWRCP